MRSFTICLLASLCFFLCSPLKGQHDQDLPRGLTQSEKAMLPNGINLSQGIRGQTAPPSFPVRTMAEWEEIQALLITWTNYTNILSEVVRHAQKECKVVIVCSDSLNVKSDLNGNGVPIDSVTFLEAPYNSVWIRDYGPNTVYRNDVDSLMMVDWIYNRPRAADDTLPQKFADHFNVPLYETSQPPYELTNPGGNFQSDGFGTGFASDLILEENGPGNDYNVNLKTEAEIDSIMDQFMGIHRYIKMDTLPYDVIHHIDMHFRLLDEETLLVGEYPNGVADGPQIEANLQYVLSNFNSVFGDPFEVVRIQMPPENGSYPNGNWWGADYRTYTNFIFVNNTLLVPTYEPQYDSSNLDILRKALPGYKVQGIDCNNIIPANGALHCISRAVGVNDPLLISHQPLDNTTDTVNDLQVDARIQHRSGIAQATLYYTNDTSTGYQSTSMALTNASTHTWSGLIPAQNAGDSVFYYIQAQATNGKTQARPMPAPKGFWRFQVLQSTGIQKEQTISTMKVFPDPADAITCIKLETSQTLKGEISLFSITGDKIKTLHRGIIKKGNPKYFLDASKYESGMYLIMAETDAGRKVRKLFIGTNSGK